MDVSIIAPYIVSILAAIISGFSSYLVAHNKSASEIRTLKEARSRRKCWCKGGSLASV